MPTQPDAVLPAPHLQAVNVLLHHIADRGTPPWDGTPQLHNKPLVEDPQCPAWCVPALPGVFGFRILAMLHIQDPDEALAYLPPNNTRPLSSDLVDHWVHWVDQSVAGLRASNQPAEANTLDALGAEQRASCVLAVAVEWARKCRALVALVRGLLEQYGVPTIGGYPTDFAYLHKPPQNLAHPHCPAWCHSSLPGVRARLAVAMLGQVVDHPDGPVAFFGRGAEKGFASDLLLQWANFRLQRIADLDAAGRFADKAALKALSTEEFAACMLAAQVQMAQDCTLYSQARHDEVAGWVPRAYTRITGLLGQWAGRAVPVAMVQVRGMRVTPKDPRWTMASNALAADDQKSECVQLMLFMFLLHANLGLWQVPLDSPDRHKERNRFYESVAQVLRYSCTEPALRNTAQRLLNALEQMPLLTGCRDNGHRELLQNIALHLPPCFNIYVGYVAPDVMDTVSQVTNDIAREKIRLVHRLADMVAEMFLDILRIRVEPEEGNPTSPPGFHWGNVAYAAARARYGESTVGKAAVKKQIRWRWRLGDDPSAEPDVIVAACDAFRRQRAAHYEYLLTPDERSQEHDAATAQTEDDKKKRRPRTEKKPAPRLINLLQSNVPRDCGPAWPGADPPPCAICQFRWH